MKNQCLKTRPITNPYEVWRSRDGQWEWKVLKKYQTDDNAPFARWRVHCVSPHMPEGDSYVNDVKKGGSYKVE